MGQIFISYKSSDKKRALELVEHLERHHLPVWIDRQSIPLASDWQEEIIKAVGQESSAVVVVWSSQTAKSEWVGIEYNLALEKNVPVIPYIIGAAELPAPLSYQNGIKQTEPNALDRLVARLQEFIHDDSALRENKINNKNASFEELGMKMHNAITIQVPSLPTLTGIPLGAVKGCLAYLIGRSEDNLMPVDRIQLVLQFSGAYGNRSFVRDVAAHFLKQNPNHKLRILWIQGPLQRPTLGEKLNINHGLGTDEANIHEWQNAVNAIRYIYEQYQDKIVLSGMQIFFQGPAVLLYKLGQINRDMIPTELYQFVREENRTYYTKVFGNLG